MVPELAISTTVMDDVEFVKCFNGVIAAHYQEAARYQKTLPEFALMRMRQVVEGLCLELASHVGLTVPTDHTLIKLIKDLKVSGKFKKAIADDLHHIRIQANKFVHVEKAVSPGQPSKVQSDIELADIVQTCRTALCRVLVAFACSIKNVTGITELLQRQFAVMSQEELIAKAVTSLKPNDKFLAGVAVDAITQDFLSKEVGLILTEQQKFHYFSLQRLAATFYLAAIELDANLDEVPSQYLSEIGDRLAFTRCDTEYLFRFADVVVHGDIGEELKAKGVTALESAAKKGHVPAKALLAGIYYQNANYEPALKLALAAVDAGEFRAVKILFYYYAEGNACAIDKTMARRYLDIGVENGYLPALTLLGQELCIGERLDKQKAAGLQYLQQAAEQGDPDAIKFIPLFDGTKEREIQERSQSVLTMLKNYETIQEVMIEAKRVQNQQLAYQQKVGVNDPCPCKSGKKYKKCCKK